MTSGPKVMLGTNCPSITSHWMRSHPAASSAAISSPRRAKSAGRTDGAISMRGTEVLAIQPNVPPEHASRSAITPGTEGLAGDPMSEPAP